MYMLVLFPSAIPQDTNSPQLLRPVPPPRNSQRAASYSSLAPLLRSPLPPTLPVPLPRLAPRWGMPMTTDCTPRSAAVSMTVFMPGIRLSAPSRPNLRK